MPVGELGEQFGLHGSVLLSEELQDALTSESGVVELGQCPPPAVEKLRFRAVGGPEYREWLHPPPSPLRGAGQASKTRVHYLCCPSESAVIRGLWSTSRLGR